MTPSPPAHPTGHSGRPGRSGRLPSGQGPAVLAVAVGGALGAAARYGAVRAWPPGADAFPWSPLLVNGVGCTLTGILMVTLKERFPHAPALLNPLLGTGFLGGFTTFSTYADDARLLFERGDPGLAFAHIVLTVVAAPSGVTSGVLATRAAFGLRVGAGVG